ncbi:TonB-dependent siderophore receptor [Phormidium tenue FACHB-886]|nr:TonB-dependent siderophore receptor [Phormidium tenue FACHB-886]
MDSQDKIKARLRQKGVCFLSWKFICRCFVILAVAGIQPAQAQDLSAIGVDEEVARELQQASSSTFNSEGTIARLSELERPATTVEEWLAQATVQITGVQINSTDTGFEILLETATAQQLDTATSVIGNALITDIPNAALALPEGAEFQTANPIDGIALVTVTPRGTGVRIIVTGVEAPPTAAVRTDAQNLILSIATGTANAAGATDTEAIQVVVTGEQDEGYNPSTATTGTRIEAPLRDVPLTLQVIPREVIEDRQIVNLTELADNVPGVEPVSGYGGLPSNDYYIRGFNAGESFRNGFRDFTFISPRDPANVEQVEFLRGPASVLYGGGFNLTGAINTITERPLAEPRYQIDATVGSYEFYRPTLDFTGPLTEDNSLLYRLNLAYTNTDSFRDFNERESTFVAPVLTWNIDSQTSLTAEFEYQNYDYVFDRGFPPGEVFLELPRERFLFEPDLNRAQFDSYYFSYNFEHEFNDQWKIRQGFGGLVVEGNTEAATLSNFSAPFVAEDGRTIERGAQRSDELQENFSVQTELLGEFSTGSINHNLLVGVEYARYRFAYDFFDASLGSIDIFDPEYGDEPGDYSPSSGEEYGTRNVGVYFQDLIYLTSNLIVLGGGRLDFNDSFYRDTLNGSTNNERSDTSFSPRLGIVYQPGEDTSLYFNWANAFTPNIFGGRSRTGEAFEPEEAEQFELGLKQEFFDDRLSANLALYNITRQNVSTTDPEDPDFNIQTGEQTSRGVELDVTGEILPGWNVIATYAYTDAFVSEDNTIPEDDRLAGIPEHTASLWTTYEIQSGSLQGLGFGLGLVYVDEREAQLPNTGVTLPSFFRTDVRLSYRRDNWLAALNIKNLFDIEYYNTQGFFIMPQAPFTVLANISVEF